jgi:hypothetical protein
MLNTVDALAVQLFQKREGASNRLDRGSGSHGVLLNMLFSRQAALLPRSIQRNDASSHWTIVYFWRSMIADRSRSSLSGLDRFISSASRADDRNKELTVVPSGRGQLAQVLSV